MPFVIYSDDVWEGLSSDPYHTRFLGLLGLPGTSYRTVDRPGYCTVPYRLTYRTGTTVPVLQSLFGFLRTLCVVGSRWGSQRCLLVYVVTPVTVLLCQLECRLG